MRNGLIVTAFVLVAATATLAKDAPSYDRGLLVSMNSSPCGTTEKGSKTLAGELLGTDAQHKNTQEVLCQEYVLQGDRIMYHIRPVDTKHPKLLPVGDNVQYRIHKDQIYLLNREGDTKERKYTVTSMQVRQEVKEARNLQ